MFEGLPSLFNYVADLVMRGPRRDSLAVVIYHLLGDVVNAGEHALVHYLPLTLEEDFLQNSSIGTPYQKWARFTNEDFENFDRSLFYLVPAVWQWYHRKTFDLVDLMANDLTATRTEIGSPKDAWCWFDRVCDCYGSCKINSSRPELTVWAINIRGWVDPDTGFFVHRISPVHRPPGAEVPPVVTPTTWDIQDRERISELAERGHSRLVEMRSSQQRLADWLRATYTVEDILARHEGTLQGTTFGLSRRYGLLPP